MREGGLFPFEKAHLLHCVFRPDVLLQDIAEPSNYRPGHTNHKSFLTIYHRDHLFHFIMLSHLARIWKHDYVLIISEPAPDCGNSETNHFLDRCLSRLCDYKIASRDPLGNSEFGFARVLGTYVEL